MKTREKMVEKLVNSDFEYIMSGDGMEILDIYLRYGFKGYDSFSDDELKVEYKQRKENGLL